MEKIWKPNKFIKIYTFHGSSRSSNTSTTIDSSKIASTNPPHLFPQMGDEGLVYGKIYGKRLVENGKGMEQEDFEALIPKLPARLGRGGEEEPGKGCMYLCMLMCDLVVYLHIVCFVSKTLVGRRAPMFSGLLWCACIQ